MQAGGIRGDHLHILVNKLLSDKKSRDSELNQCNLFVPTSRYFEKTSPYFDVVFLSMCDKNQAYL